jgi:protein DGCR14
MSSAKPEGPVGRELAVGGAGGLMLPPPPRLPAKRKEVVLEEDDWTATLEAIIERDFFPELPKLESKIAWLQVGAAAGQAAGRRR